MANKLRIAIACSSLTLGKGGSERAAVNLAEAMTLRGHSVLLISCIGPNGNTTPAYPIAKGVNYISVNSTGWHGEISFLRNLLLAKNIDIFLALGSSSIQLYWSAVCMGSGIPFICSERSDPKVGIENFFWNRAGRLAVLSGSDCIHEMLPIYTDSIPESFHNPVAVIPNSAPEYPCEANIFKNRRKSILYMARICDIKRPHLLVDAFSMLMDKFQDWHLDIWGHGPQENAIRRQISYAGAEKRIHFHGLCDDIASVYSSAQIYCLPSSFEGFPNTVLEAMSAGLPIIGFKSCRSVANIIAGGNIGLLAPEDTPESLAATLECLMNDDELRTRLGAAAQKVAGNYSPKIIFDKWERLLQKIAESKNNTFMDKFKNIDFAYKADLSTSARSEWVFRNFGEAMPWTFARIKEKIFNLVRRLVSSIIRKFQD